MKARTGLCWITGGMLLLLLGCADAPAPEPGIGTVGTDEAPNRDIVAAAWDTVWQIGGSIEDTVLLRPRLITAVEGGIAFYDDDRHAVRRIDRAGEFAWEYGRRGGGPDEFEDVRDIKSLRDEVFVLDPANRRITRLDENGRVLQRIPLGTVGHAEQMTPLPSGRIVLMTLDPEAPFVVIDREGTVRSPLSLPGPQYGELETLARQGWMTAARAGGVWAFAYSMGTGWTTYDGIEPVRKEAGYVESVPFPRIVASQRGNVRSATLASDAPCSACRVALADSTLWVLFGGRSPVRDRVIDRYRVSDARYVGSVLLPVEATEMAVGDDAVYLLAIEQAPTILALRPRNSLP